MVEAMSLRTSDRSSTFRPTTSTRAAGAGPGSLGFRLVVSGLFVAIGLLGGPSSAFAQAGSGAENDEGAEGESTELSQAERIMALRTLLASDRAWRDQLDADVRSVKKAYREVSDAFVALTRKVSRARQSAGEAAGVTEEALKSLEAERSAARDRFDALIGRRSALEKQLEVLEAKIAFETAVLDNLVAGRPLASAFATFRRASDAPSAAPAPSDTRAPKSPIPGLPSLPGLGGPSASSVSPAKAEPKAEALVVDRSVADARERLRKAEADLSSAEAELELIDYAIALFEEDLESAQGLRDAAREVEAAARSELDELRAELEAARADEAPAPRIAQLSAKEEDVLDRLTMARDRLARQDERIENSRSVVESMRRNRGRLVRRLESAREAVIGAGRHLAFVKSPLAPHRLIDWLRQRGPEVLIIIALMFGFRWLANLISRRLIVQMIGRTRRGDEVARQERAETLGRVFRSTATVAILVVGLLAILNQAGMDITVLLGGAAVFGAAIAFGSQSLIKDYFSGFMLLAENQYSVGNIIRIGSSSGVVEDINLRVTVLRDLEGIVHFIPHSQVSQVSNLTYGWSRALFDIGVAYKEDVNQVMNELVSLGEELRSDEKFGPMILDDPEMLGVDAFGDSAVVIKFFIKTRPLMQWSVKREMLRRIKMRFDDLGVEIPFPHRTVFHRTAGGADASVPPSPEPTTAS